jgi:hypothetical protein
MDIFSLYFQLGIEHILDLNGFDHMLFIITLCAVYFWKDWKNILILITAFTLGHSVTLALSALDIFRLPTALVETLIPVTIFLTAIYNIWTVGKVRDSWLQLNYFLAMVFGFIHGMGFSNFFRGLHPESSNIVTELLAFNIGIEIGQILIVLCFLAIYAILDFFIFIKQRDWALVWSGVGAGISFVMLLEGLTAG